MCIRDSFWGPRLFEGGQINLRDVFGYINRLVLFRGQWQYRRGRRSEEEYRHFVTETVEPKFYRWCERAIERRLLRPRLLYGYFPCYSEENSLVVLHPPGTPNALTAVSYTHLDVYKRQLRRWRSGFAASP